MGLRYPAVVERLNLRSFDAPMRYREDRWPLPIREERELYFDDDHVAYWLSGLIDYEKMLRRASINPRDDLSILEIGCATGRLLRHMLREMPNAQFWGADLKRSNIDWLRTYIQDERLSTLHNSDLPYLPLDSGQFDLVVALSVFTHIDYHEEEWLLELRRLLKPGGKLYLSIISDHVWTDIGSGQLLGPTYRLSHEFSKLNFELPMPSDRFVFHGVGEGDAYMETVLHHRSYIIKNWCPFFSSCEWHHRGHDYQDVLVLKK